tara:strand:- start:849 stop:965 length:117 start_codon:yes stop_codon:yes gene_type:complete
MKRKNIITIIIILVIGYLVFNMNKNTKGEYNLGTLEEN